MTINDIIRYRLQNQQLARTEFLKPEEIVEWQGAVQSQDYAGGLWGLGLRLPGTTLGDIEKALSDRKIIRTWPMRGTLHFVPARDARWMLELLTPRVISRFARRYKELGLTEETFKQSKKLFTKALKGGRHLTRDEMYAALAKGGVLPDGQRGYHILAHLAQKGVICFGARQGKQQTFVLFDEWVAAGNKRERDEALAELAGRYFTSHGPATLQDFMWWSGLPAADVRVGMELIKREMISEDVRGQTYWMSPDTISGRSARDARLLPPYDEYLIAYKDRNAAIDPAYVKQIIPERNPAFSSPFIIGGRVEGTWKRVMKKDGIVITVQPFRKLSPADHRALSIAADRYGTFLKMPVLLS